MRTDHRILLDLTGEGDEILEQYDFGTVQPGEVSDGFPDEEIVETEAEAEFGFGTQAFGTSPFGGSGEQVPVARFVYPTSYEDFELTRQRNDSGGFRMQIPGDRELSRWVEADAYVLGADGTLQMVGKVWDSDHSESDSMMRLSGVDLLGQLERGSAELTYRAMRAYTAFEEYVETFLPEWSISVEEPSVNQTTSNETVQSVDGVRAELESATDFGERDPFEIVNGKIVTLDTAWTVESTMYDSFTKDGEDSDGTSTYHESGSQYSAGEAIRFENSGDNAVYSFNPQHTIPQVRVGVRASCEDAPEVQLRIDGSEPVTLFEEGETTGFEWADLRLFDPDWSEVNSRGEITIEAVTAPTTSSGYADIDVVSPRDIRYPVTFDNNPDPRVSGPETKPRGATLVTNRVDVGENITRAWVDADITVSSFQGIEASNDRQIFEGELETDSIDVDLRSQYGYGVEVRFTFDRFGTRTGETPTSGFESTELGGWEVSIDANDLKIIDERELTDNHLQNLRWIAERARLSFYSDATAKEIDAFHRGQRQRDLVLESSEYEDITTQNSTGEEYANRVVVRGARDEDGVRYEGSAEDEAEIALLEQWGTEDGVVEYTKTDSTITSENEAETEADSILDRMVKTREFDGSVNGVDPSAVAFDHLQPGVEYYIEQWEAYSILNGFTLTQTEIQPEFGELESDKLVRRISENQSRADEAHRT